MVDLRWADQSDGVGAIVNSIFQGQTTGTAVARALFGVTNPAGRLPISYYRDITETGTIDDYLARTGSKERDATRNMGTIDERSPMKYNEVVVEMDEPEIFV